MNMIENEIKLEESSQASETKPILPSVGKPKGFMQKIQSKIIGNGSFDMSKSIQSANSSYLMSKYGHSYSTPERLENFLKELTASISEKNSRGEFACVKVLPDDLIEYKAGIIGLFKEKGYVMTDLKELVSNISQSYIFICWDKFDPSADATHE